VGDTQHIGGNVRRLRHQLGFTQDELVETSGVAKQTVVDIEHGRRPRVRPSTLRKLADAFGVEYEVLIKGEGARLRSQGPLTVEWALAFSPAEFRAETEEAPYNWLVALDRKLSDEFLSLANSDDYSQETTDRLAKVEAISRELHPVIVRKRAEMVAAAQA